MRPKGRKGVEVLSMTTSQHETDGTQHLLFINADSTQPSLHTELSVNFHVALSKGKRGWSASFLQTVISFNAGCLYNAHQVHLNQAQILSTMFIGNTTLWINNS